MTSRLLQPKYLALDTSHLAQWAAAKASTDAAHRARAQVFERWLEDSGYVVLLCLHHIAELAGHDNEAVAAMRLRFIANLPFVAWIGGMDGGAGTIVTLLSEEVRAACAVAEQSLQQVRDSAKSRLIQVGCGEDLLGVAPEVWLSLRPEFASQAEHARAVVAFSRLGTVDISDKPMAQLMSGRVRRGDQLRRQIDLMTGTFAAHIAERADQRIGDPERLAAVFMRAVSHVAEDAPASAAELVLRALALQGVTAADITPTSTVGDMLELGRFRAQLKIAAEATGIAYEFVVRTVRPDQLPSWRVSRALERHLPDLPKREGGELTDTHLACLAAYADATLVDKRTWEGTRRLRHKDRELAALIGRVERAARYDQILQVLAL